MPRLSQSDTELEVNRNAEIWTRKVENTLASCRTRRTAREKYYLKQNDTKNIVTIHSSNRKTKNISKEDLTIEIPSGTEYESSGESSFYKESQHSSTNYSGDDGTTGDRIYNEIELVPKQSAAKYNRYTHVNPQHHHIYSIDELSGESDYNNTSRQTECKKSYFVNASDSQQNVKPFAKQSQFFYVSVKQSVPITRIKSNEEYLKKNGTTNFRRLTKSSDRLPLSRTYSKKDFHSSDDSTEENYKRRNNINSNSTTKFERKSSKKCLASSESSCQISGSADIITSNDNDESSINENLNSKTIMEENLIVNKDLKKKRSFCQYLLCCCGSKG